LPLHLECEDVIWWEVSYDALARKKVGCLLRDYLHTQYRSSAKAKLAKLAKRKARKTMAQESTFYYDTDLRHCMRIQVNTVNKAECMLTLHHQRLKGYAAPAQAYLTSP
jgi:hypothetical protein